MMQNYCTRLASNRNFHDTLGNARQTLLSITCLYKICFYNAGFIDSNIGPFTIQGNATARKSSAFDNVDFLGKLLDTCTSWQFRQHGSLGPLDLFEDFLATCTSWQIRQHGSLGPSDLLEDLGLLAIFLDLPWENS